MNKTLGELNELFKPTIIDITTDYNDHIFDMNNPVDVKAFEYFKKYVVTYYSYCEEKLNVSI